MWRPSIASVFLVSALKTLFSGVAETNVFKYPHNKKSKGLKSKELGGHMGSNPDCQEGGYILKQKASSAIYKCTDKEVNVSGTTARIFDFFFFLFWRVYHLSNYCTALTLCTHVLEKLYEQTLN